MPDHWPLLSLQETSLFCLTTTLPGKLSYIYSNYCVCPLCFLTLGKVLYITEQMCQDLFMLSFASNRLPSNYPGTMNLSSLCKSLSEISHKTYYLPG